jgi:probable HAF family extracellular repeat protein
MVGLGDLPGGDTFSTVQDLSADGTAIVGWSSSYSSAYEAYLWTESSGWQGLGDWAGGDFYSEALGVSADGSVVVGYGTTASGQRAFIWDENNGMRYLKNVLENNYGLDLTGWTLNWATSISDDGLTIVGGGNNPQGASEAWIARLVELVALDIKARTCPNPVNVRSRGVLSAAILGSEEFDVNAVDPASIKLAGVSAIRSGLEDVASPVTDGNECDCSNEGPDGYVDLNLRFRTEEIVEELVDAEGDLIEGQLLSLTITGRLLDDTAIEGTDCVVLVGNVSKWLAAKDSDINEDGKVDLQDFADLAAYWLESERY